MGFWKNTALKTMKIRKTILFSLILYCSFFVYRIAASQNSIESLKKEIALKTEDQKKIRTAIRSIEGEILELSKEITELKLKERNSRSFFGSIKLDNLLKQSEKIEKKLKEEELKLQAITKQINEKNTLLMNEYTAFLKESKRELGEMKNRKSEAFNHILEEYAKIAQEREKLVGEPLIKPIDFSGITISYLDTQGDIEDKIDILNDYQEKMTEQRLAVVLRLNELKDRKTLIDQVRQFDEELQFFSDDFVKFATKVKDSEDKDTETEEEKSTNADDNTVATEETTEATPQSETDSAPENSLETESDNGGDTSTQRSPVSTENATSTTTTPTEELDTDKNTVPENISTRSEQIAPFKNSLDTVKEIPLHVGTLEVMITKLASDKRMLDMKIKKINEKIKHFKNIAKKRGEIE